MPSTSVLSAAVGKIVRASAITEAASSGEREHAAGDEQRDQRQREDRQQQVVRHHRREAGETVLVGLAPEGGDGYGRRGAHRP